MKDVKLAELVTMKTELPVKGDKMLAKKADKSYAKVFMQETIGLNGMLALLILSKLNHRS